MKSIKCKHYNGDGYEYCLSDEEVILICRQCHLNLAGEIVKQMAIEVFAEGIIREGKE